MDKIGFLGFGNMAKAIARGIIGTGFIDQNNITAYDPIGKNIDNFEWNILKSKSAFQMSSASKYILICVKPQMLDDAVREIIPSLNDSKIIVSIAAGVTVEHIRELTNSICPVVRTMPNTPLLLGNGTTAIARPELILDADYNYVCGIFQCVGSLYEIPSNRFNEVVPVNGSSPAFIYLFAKTIAESAGEAGIEYKDALEMIADTLIGSGRMIKESGYNINTLIDMVSSKGGTTVAALNAMERNGFSASLREGITACVKRAYELGDGS